MAKATGGLNATSTLISGFGKTAAGLYGRYGAGGFPNYVKDTGTTNYSNRG